MTIGNDVDIHPTAIVHENVNLGAGTKIGPFAIVGEPLRGTKSGELETIIGPNSVIRSHTVIYAGNKIGLNFQSGHKVNIRELNEIGDDVSIGTHSIIEHHVKIMDKVRIHSAVFIPEYSTLEEECWIGPNVVFTNVLHPLCPDAKKCIMGPTIKRGAKIGANVTIVPDVTIGEMALVGAGSVVISNIASETVVAGYPAKMIKSIADLGCPYDFRKSPYMEGE